MRKMYAFSLVLLLAACGGPDGQEALQDRSGAVATPAGSEERPVASGVDAAAPDAFEAEASTHQAGDSPVPARSGQSTSASAPAGGEAAPATDTASAAAILRRAERAYAGVRSMEADFVQRVTVPLLDQTQNSRGKIYHRRPDRFLMRFSDPQGDVIVADGRHLWMYYPSTDARQVLRTSLAEAGSTVDLQEEFLNGADRRYAVSHLGVENVAGRPADRLRLIPREPSQYAEVTIWVDRQDAMVRRFRMVEQNESVRLLELSNLKPNVTLSDDLFRFTPPPGAEVFES